VGVLKMTRGGGRDGRYGAAMDGPSRAADEAQALCDRGRALHEAGRHGEALAAFSAAVELLPASPRAHFFKGFTLLLLGRWDEGWREYAWRARLEPGTSLPGPAWDGSALGGRTVLLEAEQGLGDTLQMLRYVPLAAARGGRVALAVPAPLRRLLEGFPGVVRLYGPGDVLEYDVRAGLFALPGLFGTMPDTVPPPIAPLAIPMDSPAARPVRAVQGRKIGLVWAGNPRHPNDRNRSCPLAALQPLLDVPGCRFFSLQLGAASGEAAPFGERIVALGPALADMADTAAAIAALDHVITVDTAVAHLAGTMGKPCWLLLPAAADWRWLLERSDTPWYPQMTLFRQEGPGAWRDVVGRLASALKSLH
jgi:hypothetical protein